MRFQSARRVLVSFLLLLFTFVVASPPVVGADQKVHVKGYTKKDGTKVEPHDRKAPKSGSASSDDKQSKPKAAKPPKVAKVPKRPAVLLASSGARSNRCHNCDRDEHGKILRSGKAKKGFMRATGYERGRPGYVIDHIKPLACGGLDIPSNMQWQTKADAKAKDKTERAACR